MGNLKPKPSSGESIQLPLLSFKGSQLPLYTRAYLNPTIAKFCPVKVAQHRRSVKTNIALLLLVDGGVRPDNYPTRGESNANFSIATDLDRGRVVSEA